MYEDDGIYHLLLKINHKNFAIGFAYLKEADLHPGQMPLITSLYKREGVTQKEIADKLGIKPSTINVMIRRLEKKEFVIRKQDPEDQRRSLVYLTVHGRRIYEKISGAAVEIKDEVMKTFTEEEKDELFRLLTKFYEGLEKLVDLEMGTCKCKE
ncbi:MarR family winged helix-turn-helix transcriptional regulator [Anaerostipes sp.]|uniref:MarR family winged helix-turn-helix transcriptional regulator n=1 Tax=Anaerostipes sp. TaxID=1872530 RepID=UPI0025C72065|nr:MarR family transcriptional regulator [Anaerostipes sp.]MBS7007234.1 MarR family transcriptional regulator [Anaerostipes sp.]